MKTSSTDGKTEEWTDGQASGQTLRQQDMHILTELGLGRARQARWGLAGLGKAWWGLAELIGSNRALVGLNGAYRG